MIPIAIGRIMKYKNTSFLAEIKMKSYSERIKDIFPYYFDSFKRYSKLNVVLLHLENIGIVF